MESAATRATPPPGRYGESTPTPDPSTRRTDNGDPIRPPFEIMVTPPAVPALV